MWPGGQSSWLYNGDVLCFLWRTNWIYICYVEESRPPLWSSGQSSWLQIQRSGFDSRHYQIFCELVGLERGPLRPVSTIEELLGRKGSCSGLESRQISCGMVEMPDHSDHASKAWTVLSRLNTRVVDSILTWGMDVYVSLFCLRVVPFVCSGLIPRPRSPAYML
jgi:hypothetical protein